MKTTLAIDEKVLERASEAAHAMGKSLEQAICEYIDRLAGEGQRAEKAAAYERSALQSPGRLNGWHFDRDELHGNLTADAVIAGVGSSIPRPDAAPLRGDACKLPRRSRAARST